MKRNPSSFKGPEAIDLIDEAMQLLRLAPGQLLAGYFLGTLPFVLMLLYFTGDMTHSAFAYDRCAPGALGLAVVFVWMKTWQVIFCAGLRAQVAGRRAEPVSVRKWLSMAMAQAAIQPWGLFALPVAALLTLPFGWVMAFFQNATVLGDVGDTRTIRRNAMRMAQVWPMQNHLVLGIISLFALFVFFNVLLTMFQLPHLIKMFTGIESVFTMSPWAMFNTTFFMACVSLTWLCVDPLVKAVYVLRCHYGASIQNGDDLLTDLRLLRADAAKGVALVLLLVCTFAATAAEPAAGGAPAAGSSAGSARVSPPDLDRAIEKTLNQREFTWRLPRQAPPEEPKGWLATFMESVFTAIRDWFRDVMTFLRDIALRIIEWFRGIYERMFGNRSGPGGEQGGGRWMIGVQFLVFACLAASAAVAAVLVLRYLQRRRRQRVPVAGEVVPAVPDLADENVVANQLPEDGWLKLAREMVEKGELRLALRALYLASLAHLESRELISVARFKTNLDYERELRRRARSKPELQAAFSENVLRFDRAWYGLHEVSKDVLESFRANNDKIRAC